MTNRQTEANKKWQEKNRERAKYLRKRSAARTFVTKHGKLEDLISLRNELDERIKVLQDER